ncbi:EipA family protein [Ahrensia kielensis]|uniref:EipA family protein n=1 Tax=Ahrensia kielensis TaxID=76980 RepID=A0ABU9T625_9HYPH
MRNLSYTKSNIRLIAAVAAFLSMVMVALLPSKAVAQTRPDTYALGEMVDAGHRFFGSTSSAVAQTIEQIFARYGMPNGYVLGQEGSGAFIGGLTYGEGTLHTKNVGDHNVFWQGPSIGFDYGGDGARTMMLVYNLDSVDALHGRYGGVQGSAYLIAGVGMHVLKRNNILLVPVRTGVGARLGVSLGYLKLTPMPTWNPF